MRDDFALFIAENYSPGVQGYIKSSFDIFEELEIEEYDLVFSAILMDETPQNETVADRFYTQVRENLKKIISEFEVTLIEDPTPDQLLSITEALVSLPRYSNPIEIMTLIEGEDVVEETLCDCLALVSDKTAREFGAFIETVPKSFLDRLYTYFSDRDTTDTETDADDVEAKEKQELLEKLRAFKVFLKYDEAVGFEMIRGGTDVGYSFDYYAQSIKKHMELKDLPRLAKEIAVILLMAKDTFRNPLVSFNERSNLLFEDINRIAQLDIVLRATFIAFEKFCVESLEAKGLTNEQV